MQGLGTIINALAILIGGVLGILFKRFLKESYQDTIIKATGFSVVFMGSICILYMLYGTIYYC